MKIRKQIFLTPEIFSKKLSFFIKNYKSIFHQTTKLAMKKKLKKQNFPLPLINCKSFFDP